MSFCKFSSDYLMESFTLVDNLFMNEYLPYAEEGYIKVYLYGLYLCTNPSGRDNSVESFAKVLDMDEDKILEIFKYWQDQGLLEIISELLSCGTLENVTLRTLPWLPLYGICGLLILLLLKKYIKKPASMFIINFIVYTVLDYLIQLFLDLGFGIELPKYHSYLAFMNGEAYLGDGAVFALLGCAFFYYFAPRWNSLFMKLKKWMRISICILLTAIFVFDLLSGIIQY